MVNPKPAAFTAAPQTDGKEAITPRAGLPPACSEAQTRMSVFGADLTLLGDNITIISQSKLQVDAQIRGDIHAKEVVINPEGSVSGEVWAEKIDVGGEVRGSMIAVTLALRETARVAGDILHQKLSVAEGAEFVGRVHLIRDPSELIPILDAEAIEHGRKCRVPTLPRSSDRVAPLGIRVEIKAA
jgi:cytoskeletal protein CcmA (bactofilin family)